MRDMVLMRALLICFCVLSLNSCVSPKPPTPEVPSSITTASYPADLQGARLYKLSSKQSKLHILVYRAGAAAQLGHNHVVSSQTLSGYVWLHDSLTRSGFDIVMPVNELIVDEPGTRIAEGEDFPLNVSEDGRVGTKRNMLLPTALDGEHYPVIRLRSVGIAGDRAQPVVKVQITIKDQTRELDVPVQLQTNARTLSAQGQFEIKQTDFGLVPQSAILGTLLVQDALTIKFDLVAMQ
ncbi:MAG: YceI family protein [Steroidobacteraceae bacterium]